MDSSLSNSGSLNSGEASQILKDLLNVGKSPLGLGQPKAPKQKMADERMENGRASQSMDTPPRAPQGATAANGSFDDFRKVYQKIILDGDDKKGSMPVFGRDVEIIPSAASSIDSQTPGSSKVKITPVVNYDWEHRYYYGNLVAVNTTYLVYVLKVHPGYGLRILNRRTVERALLKGFVDVITDVAFAHHNSNVLGCIDRRGNISVWQLHETGGKIQYTPRLNVTRSGTQSSDFHRLMWCPFLPDDPTASEDSSSTTNEGSRMLAVTHDNHAELWDVDVATELYSTKPIEFDMVREGVIKVYDGHTKAITDTSVSPDGSVLATCSLDGTVKFWQMYWEATDPPRRLHQFSPHEGKPVSALLFCDNHKYQDPSLPFWRFLITGADYNSELKVWCTVSWTCLQKLQLNQPGLTPQPSFKVKLDLSASYVIMTDIKRKVLYVLQLFQDPERGQAHVTSISEFLLMQPMLSFAVVDAGKCKIKAAIDDGEDGEEMNSGDLDNSLEDKPKVDSVGVKVKMFCVNSRSVQDLQVRFTPCSSVEHDMGGSISSASQDDIALRDGLSDMSFNTTSQSGHTATDSSQSDLMSSRDGQDKLTSSFSSESAHSPSQPYLMTPDAFTSKSLPPTLNNKGLRDSGSSTTSSITQVTAMGTSIDDLLGSSHTSSDSTRVITPDSSITLTPSSTSRLTPLSLRGTPRGTPSAVPLPPMTPGEVPLPPMTPGEVPLPPVTPGERAPCSDSDDEGPKSPPPSPVGCTTPEQLTGQQPSSEKLGHLLENARRMSESSVEVAQIMKQQLGEEDEEAAEDKIDKMVEEKEDEEEKIEKEDSSDEDEPPVDEKSNDSSSSDSYQEVVSDAILFQEAQRMAEMSAKKLVDTPSDDPSGRVQSPGSDGEPYYPGYGTRQAVQASGGREVVTVGDDSNTNNAADDELEAKVNLPAVSMDGPYRDRGDQALSRDDEALTGIELRKMFQQLWGVVTATKDEMLVLRRDFTKMQSSNSIIQSMKARIDKLDKSMGTKLESVISKSQEQERQRLDKALQEKQALDKQKQERLLETVSQTLKQSVTSRLDNTIKSEITNKVVPELQRIMKPVEEQLNTTIAQKLTATDQLMKENISKLVKSRGVTEAMGQAAANALNNTIQSTYKDAFQNTVMPGFERSCQSMFAQINAAFDVGTREYSQQLETHLNKIRQTQQSMREPVLDELKNLVKDFKTSTESMQTTIASNVQTHLTAELQKSQQKFEENLMGEVRKMVKEELDTALKEHQEQVQNTIADVVRSQAPTPVPQAQDIQHIQSQITQLLQRRQINAAFQMALSASDLRAVLFVCNTLNPEELFTLEPCPLEQPVLLSLIQQLSHDLNNNTSLKCSYLEESLLAIDPRNDVTSEHLPRVIGDMVTRLTEFTTANPTHKERKTLRKVLLQARALIK